MTIYGEFHSQIRNCHIFTKTEADLQAVMSEGETVWPVDIVGRYLVRLAGKHIWHFIWATDELKFSPQVAAYWNEFKQQLQIFWNGQIVLELPKDHEISKLYKHPTVSPQGDWPFWLKDYHTTVFGNSGAITSLVQYLQGQKNQPKLEATYLCQRPVSNSHHVSNDSFQGMNQKAVAGLWITKTSSLPRIIPFKNETHLQLFWKRELIGELPLSELIPP